MLNKESGKGFRITVVVVLVLILLVGIYLVIQNKSKPTGQVISFQPTNQKNQVAPSNENNDAELANQAANFYRGCLLNCPKECNSCGVLSFKCVSNCNDAVEQKLNKVKNRGNILSILSDQNLQWNSCYEACDTHYQGDANDYVDYTCIHGCG